MQYGAQQVLEREYGPYIVAPEPGYDFSVLIDLENLPAEQEARDELIMKLALMKRNAMAAPFERAFDEFAKLSEEASRYTSESAPQGIKEGGEVMAIHYREEEAIYIKAGSDRVTVIFSTVFREETDRIFGKVFLQEFVDARRRVLTLQNAPQVLFRNDPPLELEGVPGLQKSAEDKISYVTFGTSSERPCTRVIDTDQTVLFPRHLTPQRRYENISHIQIFRDYFHYHIKASKAYIHTRMRKRTADFLQGECGQTHDGRFILTANSAQPCPTRERGAREKDRQWPHVPSAGVEDGRQEGSGYPICYGKIIRPPCRTWAPPSQSLQAAPDSFILSLDHHVPARRWLLECSFFTCQYNRMRIQTS